MKNIAFLTSGGDSPGMNACIRAIVKSCLHRDITPWGVQYGFRGLMDGDYRQMAYTDVDNIVQRGGTILGTARCPEFKSAASRKIAIKHLEAHAIDGLIVIGGDGSFTGAHILSQETGIPIIGIPGTIDNDIYGTDHTIGYDTALNTVVDAVDKIRDTAYSHKRIFFVEVMGRNAGFIALNSAVASGAEDVLIPEEVSDIPVLVERLKSHNRGKRSSIIIVAEGDDAGGVLEVVGKVRPFLEGYDIRTSVLGHIQRGGNPSAFDRILATRMGDYAVTLLTEGQRSVMIGSSGDLLLVVPIELGIKLNSVPNLDKLQLIKRMQTR